LAGLHILVSAASVYSLIDFVYQAHQEILQDPGLKTDMAVLNIFITQVNNILTETVTQIYKNAEVVADEFLYSPSGHYHNAEYG